MKILKDDLVWDVVNFIHTHLPGTTVFWYHGIGIQYHEKVRIFTTKWKIRSIIIFYNFLYLHIKYTDVCLFGNKL